MSQHGPKLKHYVESHNIVKTTLAERMGMSPQNLYQLFKSKTFAIDTIKKLEKVLKVKWKDIDSINIDSDSGAKPNPGNSEQKNSTPAEQDTNQPIIQVVLNLSYIGKKNADSIDKMADSNLLNAKSIATLVSLLASNSDLSAVLNPLQTGQHMPDDLPAEAFLGAGGRDFLEKQKQVGKKPVKSK